MALAAQRVTHLIPPGIKISGRAVAAIVAISLALGASGTAPASLGVAAPGRVAASPPAAPGGHRSPAVPGARQPTFDVAPALAQLTERLAGPRGLTIGSAAPAERSSFEALLASARTGERRGTPPARAASGHPANVAAVTSSPASARPMRSAAPAAPSRVPPRVEATPARSPATAAPPSAITASNATGTAPAGAPSSRVGMSAPAASPETELFADMNAQRTAAGLSPLILSAPLTGIARTRSQDMAAHGYFSHVSPTGETWMSLVAAAGIRLSAGGENLARVAGDGVAVADTADALLMASPSHRANILNASFHRVGVAATTANGVTIFTTIFGN